MVAERRLFTVIEQEFQVQRDWYRIHDTDKGTGAIKVKPQDAERWNRNGWGIFQTVNHFSGPRRKDHLIRINAWAIDIDNGNKEKQLKLIEKAPLFPSLVVETKNGFHVYWNSQNASSEFYDDIVVDRLIPYFGADEKAKDIARLLRVPGYFHQKDPNCPYLISIRYWNKCAYTEKDMMWAFPLSQEKQKEQEIKNALKEIFTMHGPAVLGPAHSEGLWENVFNMDCAAALERLSGSGYVGGENYTFKRVSSGNFNIFVNGKGTSCWIDKNKRIGSMDHGGPTIAQWLKWYGRSWKEVVQILREVFPELWNSN